MQKSTGLISLIAAIAAGCDQLPELFPPRGAPPGATPPPRACTAIGCGHELSITLRPTEGTFAAGKHTVAVSTSEGGPAKVCTFDFPIGSPSAGSPCTGGMSLLVYQRTSCTTTTGSGGSVSQTCDPLAGQFEARLTLPGTPARVQVVQRTAAGPIVVRELAPVYRDSRPNGPGCPPICRQAAVELEVPSHDPPSNVACAPNACAVDADCARLTPPGGRCVQRPWTGPCISYVCE